jgi:lactate permease
VQWVLAVSGLWTMAALGAGMAGLGAAAVLLRMGKRNAGGGQQLAPDSQRVVLNWQRLGKAFAPYLLLVLIIVAGQLLLAGALDVVVLNLNFPAVETAFGWLTPAGPGRSISLFGHAGALLLYASIGAFLWFRWRGTFEPQNEYSGVIIARKTVRGSVKSTVSIVALVAMALTMQHAGMTQLLALGLSENTGALFPFLSPFVGALGAFVTGSNTNSNVIFAQLQQQTARAVGAAVPVILAAQTAGGAMGSVFAPAKVVVGVSTVADADEGKVLRLATAYGVGLLVVLGVLAWVWAGVD